MDMTDDDKMKLQALVDAKLAKKGDKVLERYGLNRTTAINALYRALVRRGTPNFLFAENEQLQPVDKRDAFEKSFKQLLDNFGNATYPIYSNARDNYVLPTFGKLMRGMQHQEDKLNKEFDKLASYDEFQKALKETGHAKAEVDSDGNVKINGKLVNPKKVAQESDDDEEDNKKLDAKSVEKVAHPFSINDSVPLAVDANHIDDVEKIFDALDIDYEAANELTDKDFVEVDLDKGDLDEAVNVLKAADIKFEKLAD